MTSISTLKQAEDALARYIPLAKEITGKDLTLERMAPLMNALDNPHRKLKIIHIAGTSGKTSTSYYTAALLHAAGKRVGLTVSPHVDSVAERIQLDMNPLDDSTFASVIDEVIKRITAAGVEPTYFELLVAAAYWYFAEAGVDYAVIETGLGGLQDATNIANNHDKICVITDIGMDHMHVLGHTVTEIARQKAGIIHPENLVLMYRQDDEITKVFQDRADEVGAELRLYDEHTLAAATKPPEDLPLYQARNWLLAVQVYEALHARGSLPEQSREALLQASEIVIPGRMEERAYDGTQIIMDGAHNEQKTEALVRSLMRKLPDERMPVLLSLKQGKEFAAVLPLLKPITSQLVITEFKGGQDLPAEAIDSSELAVAAKRFGFTDVLVVPEVSEAFDQITSQSPKRVLVTGSFYLLGQLRDMHKELQ